MSLVELPGFEQAVAKHRWRGEVLPQVYRGRRNCSRCSVGDLLRLEPATQPALFYHAGYGAAVRKTFDLCLACGHVSLVSEETKNPRHL